MENGLLLNHIQSVWLNLSGLKFFTVKVSADAIPELASEPERLSMWSALETRAVTARDFFCAHSFT